MERALALRMDASWSLQPFSQESRTPTAAKEFQIGLYDPAEAGLDHFWDSCSVGFFGERPYLIKYFMTHFQAATILGLRNRRFSLQPTAVLNAVLWNKWPADDAAGGNSTWRGNKMRVIGAAGRSGRHLSPLVNIGGGCGGQAMLVADRETVHFHGMPDRINTCLASETVQSQFRIGRDEENGAILEGQRSTDVYLSASRFCERLVLFP